MTSEWLKQKIAPYATDQQMQSKIAQEIFKAIDKDEDKVQKAVIADRLAEMQTKVETETNRVVQSLGSLRGKMVSATREIEEIEKRADLCKQTEPLVSQRAKDAVAMFSMLIEKGREASMEITRKVDDWGSKEFLNSFANADKIIESASYIVWAFLTGREEKKE